MRFTVEKLTRRVNELRNYVYSRRVALDDWKVRQAPVDGAAAPDLDDSGWESVRLGQALAGYRGSFRFRRRVAVPAELAGQPVALVVRLAEQRTLNPAEGLVYVDGHPTQGIDRHHYEVLLAEAAEPGRAYAVAVDGWAGMEGTGLLLEEASLVAVDRQAEDYYYNLLVALQVAQTLPAESYDRARILNALDETALLVDWREPGSPAFYESVRAANAGLKARLYSEPTGVDREKVTLVGHSHIDVAWLWTLAVTRQKAGRTFSTVLKLMEQYPDYRFTQSQPQLYDFLRRDYPELYERIRERLREGRWEATGGMWLEADCNVTGSESLARQFLYGRRFLREELGVECDTLWLPDVFGYSWALPQLIKAAGMSYFMTTKISWSQYNQPVNDTLYWQGIDGTKVLTHFITTPGGDRWKTYNGEVTPKSVKGCWDAYHQKDINDEVLLSFGHGDGGGGPTKEMLEVARRLKDFPGAPLVRIGTADDFFRRLDARLQGKRVPVWNGELYLEYHRGTYTTQGRNKRANRKSEVLYHAAELYGSLAGLLGAAYPREALREGWKLILLNQFHDIIPGSSIAEVYQDSAEQYRTITALGREALESSLRAIAGQVDLPGPDRALVVFNPSPFDRTDVVTARLADDLESAAVIDHAGRPVPSQLVTNEDGSRGLIFEAIDVPANGCAAYRVRPHPPGPSPQAERGWPTPEGEVLVSASPFTERGLGGEVGATVENQFYRAAFDRRGLLTSLFDKAADREVLPEGQVANLFQAFEDKPMDFDAWDVDIYYQDKVTPLDGEARVSLVEEGPVRATLQVEREFSHSRITQRIHLYAQTPRIDFATEVDWHEKHTLLKVAFPVDVRATEATFEIQFGNVQRPTHWNTSWDWARFETCAQKWADLSEGDYGVSVLNDCKYGHDVRDNVLRLSLLRSPTSPDPHADEGLHRFTYSLYPHQGSWRNGTVSEAYGLNNPLLAVWEQPHAGPLPPTYSLVRCDCPNVVVETVKQAEDSDELVVRVYEAFNQRGPVRLTFARPIAAASEVNLLEETVAPVESDGAELRFVVKPYQIRSFKVRLG